MIILCDSCGIVLGVSIVYDHGKRYHPTCYPEVCKAKLEETMICRCGKPIVPGSGTWMRHKGKPYHFGCLMEYLRGGGG